jgi:hypothetical protein
MTLPDFTSLTVFADAFLSPLIGGAIGTALRSRLPAHHLSRDAADVIKLATGVMVILVAIVLGLLVSSANTYRSSVEAEYRQGLATTVLLEEYLEAYGPQTAQIRAQMRRAVAHNFQQRWPNDDFGPKESAVPSGPPLVEIQQRILDLQPLTPAQHWFQQQALQASASLATLQHLVLGQQAVFGPLLPVFALIFLCTAAIYGSFCLFVQLNPTVVGSLFLSALAIGGAIFVIIELKSPFQGLVQISSAPAHLVWQRLAQ